MHYQPDEVAGGKTLISLSHCLDDRLAVFTASVFSRKVLERDNAVIENINRR